MDKKLEIIAFYLPQFHPFPENDEWWGKGYTEWTTVGKAKPLFKGHNQPRVPTELGYYDLRLPIIREQQAQMARDAGVTAFCYWHYWFGNGKRLMADIFDEVLESGKPDFPFCLGWANHSWYAKNWNSDGTTTNKLLIEQTYPGEEDMKMHFEFLLKAFKDKRYLKIDGAPLLIIYDPVKLPSEYFDTFREWAIAAGFPDLYYVTQEKMQMTKQEAFEKGYHAVYSPNILAKTQHVGSQLKDKFIRVSQIWAKKAFSLLKNRPPFISDYKKIYHELAEQDAIKENVIPVIIPQWDHTPRSGWNGTLFVNAKPEYFYEHAKDALDLVKRKKNPIVILKSWNEWGEGNMMEPDITYGRGFIEALRKAVDEYYESFQEQR